MQLSALARVSAFLGMTVLSYSNLVGQCPDGRTVKRQLSQADLVVYAEVAHERECSPGRVDAIDPGMVVSDCVGREAELRIRKTWKGPAQAGDKIILTMAQGDLRVTKGETRVFFAKLLDGIEVSDSREPTIWFAESDSCMLPEGLTSCSKQLAKKLDHWLKSQKD